MGLDLWAVVLSGPTVHLLSRRMSMMYGEDREQLFDLERRRVRHLVEDRLRDRKTRITHPLQQPTLPRVGSVEVTVLFHHLVIKRCTRQNIFQHLSCNCFNVCLSKAGQNGMYTILHQNQRLKSQSM
jgi:hypothetical protein